MTSKKELWQWLEATEAKLQLLINEKKHEEARAERERQEAELKENGYMPLAIFHDRWHGSTNYDAKNVRVNGNWLCFDLQKDSVMLCLHDVQAVYYQGEIVFPAGQQ